jgi:hypothetical protein
MEEYITKFKQYLNECIKKVRYTLSEGEYSPTFTKVLTEQINIYKLIIASLSVPEEKLYQNGIVYVEFEVISAILAYSNFKTSDQLAIIIALLNRNLKTQILLEDNNYCLTTNSLINYPFKYNSFAEVEALCYTGKINDILNIQSNKLTTEQKLKIAELNEFIEKNKGDFSNCRVIHTKLKTYFFDKYPHLELEDIDIVSDLLGELKVSENLISEFKEIQTREYYAQKNNFNMANIQQSVDKLLEFLGGPASTITVLNELSTNPQKEKVYSFVSILYRFLSSPSISQKYHLIIRDFKYVLPYLELDKRILLKEDAVNIIFYIINQNIKNGLLEEQAYTETAKFSNVEIPSELINFLPTNKYPYLYAIAFEKHYLNQINDHKLISLDLNTSQTKAISFSSLKKAHQDIKTSCFDKINTYNEEDINTVKNALITLEISADLVDCAIKDLTKKLVIRTKKNKKTDNIVKIVQKPKVEPKPVLNKKEYNTIYRELLTFFDFDKMRPFKSLSLPEIIYCLALIDKIDLPQNISQEFLNKIDKYISSNLYNLIASSNIEEKISNQANPILINAVSKYANLLNDTCTVLAKNTYITLEEITSCIKQMTILNIPDNLITMFINLCEMKNKLSKTTALKKYNDLKDKLDYYKDNKEINKLLQELQEAILNQTNNGDPFYEEYLEMLMNMILDLIPSTYEYEMNIATNHAKIKELKNGKFN